jgi:predicted TPR repeat methyltransferase
MDSTDPTADAASNDRELSLSPEDALQLAIERHKVDQLDDAELIYKVLLERWPDHPDVLSYMGVLQHQRGNHERALGLLRHALEIVPNAPGVWNNLGNVLLRMNQSEEAESAFRRSIELADNPEAQANLSSLLRRRRLWSESEAACRRAIELDPDFGDAWHNLSLTLLRQDRVLEGIQAANKALVLLPPHKRRRDSYARALVLAGQVEQAAAIFRDWLAEEPNNPYVRHHLAACSGDDVPERASDGYVEHLFDNFASTFDAKLAKLRYRAPQLVADALCSSAPAPARQFDIADIGCGTGLCGPLVKPWAKRLSGCDLSGAMLDRARQRDVYDVLEKGELVQFLEGHPDSFDIVVSADTLCYFGDLHGVAEAARRALRAGGQFLFTVEAWTEEDKAPYRLLANGRYAHRFAYLQSVLSHAGLHPQRIVGEVLREESALPVHGWLVTASLGS